MIRRGALASILCLAVACTAIVDAGSYSAGIATGMPCSGSNQCVFGTTCFLYGDPDLGICTKSCREHSNCTDQPRSEGCFKVSGAEEGWCTQGCHPSTQVADCREGVACYSVAASGTCDITGPRAKGEPCDTSEIMTGHLALPAESCAVGLVCLGSPAGGHQCYAQCSVSGAACGPDEVCTYDPVEAPRPVTGDEWGVCVNPAA